MDPANHIDPSGNISLPSVLQAVAVTSTLVGIATTTYSIIDFASEPTAEKAMNSAIGIGLTALGGGGLKLLKMLGSSRIKKVLKQLNVKSVQDLKGKDLEVYLHKALGYRKGFQKAIPGKSGSRDFDAASADDAIWFEAKSSWDRISSKGLTKFKSITAEQKKVANYYGKDFQII